MHIQRTVGAVLTGAALLVCAACSQDLNVTNPNSPDVARALASASDVQNLAVSSVHAWYIGATQVDPWVMLNVTGDLMTMNYGNFAARFNNVEPRIAYNNNTASGDEEAANDPWVSQYGTIGDANNVLLAVSKGLAMPGGTAKYAQLAQFTQAGAYMELALVFDKAFLVDETFDASKGLPPFAPYDSVAAFAKKKIDALIAATSGESYTYTSAEFPVSVNPPVNVTDPRGVFGNSGPIGGGFSSQVMYALANTWGAQLLAYTPRTAAEAATVNWAQVLAYTKKGIGQGSSAAGAPFDFAVVGDYNTWWTDFATYFNMPTWMMIDLKLVSQMAPNVPNVYTGLPATSDTNVYDAVWAPQAPYDARLGIDTKKVTSYVPNTDEQHDYVYTRQVQGSASRGIYMQSPYNRVRMWDYSYDAPSPQIGPAPMVMAAENDLLEAEALVRTGGDLNLAAQLVNTTRVGRGHLTPLTAATSTASFLQAITYELEVECDATDGYGFFALRAMDQLQAGTLRHLPVPATELSTDNLPVYTYGGVGLPDMSVMATGGAMQQAAFNVKKYEAGPFRTLDLPNGSTIQLPSPHALGHANGVTKN